MTATTGGPPPQQPAGLRRRRRSSSAIWKRVRNMINDAAFNAHPFLNRLKSRLSSDGRVEMNIPSEQEADSIMRTVVRRLSTLHDAAATVSDGASHPADTGGEEGAAVSRTPTIVEVGSRVPPLSIVIMIVGTRGDVQPFIALSQRLQSYGHRVRLATHECFRGFVVGHGIEFYPLGGDPMKLAAYVVKNGGAMPASMGEAMDKLSMMKEIIVSDRKSVV